MIGQRIAALRRRASMSQSALARALGVSPSAVGMYEQGRREPSAACLVAIARLFGVTTDYLLTGQPVGAGDYDALAQMVGALVDLSELRLQQRRDRPFTREELELLIGAMVTEP